MGRLIFLLLAAPFWVHFLIAGGLGYAGHSLLQTQQVRYEAKVRMANARPPAEISIVDYQKPASRGMPEEVVIRAQIATDYNIRLVKKTNGVETSERFMFTLVAPDAAEGSKKAFGAIILTEKDKDAFADWALQQVAAGGDFGALGPVITIPGLRGSPSDSSHANDALSNQGLSRSDNFLYIEPFLKGRAAGLAVTAADKAEDAFYHYLPALIFALLGAVKFRVHQRGRRPKAASGSPQTIMAAGSLTASPMPATAPRSPFVEPTKSLAPDAALVAPAEVTQQDAFKARIAAMMSNPRLTGAEAVGLHPAGSPFAPVHAVNADQRGLRRATCAADPAIRSLPTPAQRLGGLLSSTPKAVGVLGMAVLLYGAAKLLPMFEEMQGLTGKTGSMVMMVSHDKAPAGVAVPPKPATVAAPMAQVQMEQAAAVRPASTDAPGAAPAIAAPTVAAKAEPPASVSPRPDKASPRMSAARLSGTAGDAPKSAMVLAATVAKTPAPEAVPGQTATPGLRRPLTARAIETDRNAGSAAPQGASAEAELSQQARVVAQVRTWLANQTVAPVASGAALLLFGLLTVIFRRSARAAPVRPDPFERLWERRRAELALEARA